MRQVLVFSLASAPSANALRRAVVVSALRAALATILFSAISAFAATSEDFAREFELPALLRVRIREGVGQLVAGSFLNRYSAQHNRRMLPEGALQDNDVRRVLVELDAVTDGILNRTTGAKPQDLERLKDVTLQQGTLRLDDIALDTAGKRAWAHRASSEIAGTSRLETYSLVLRYLAPAKLGANVDLPNPHAVVGLGAEFYGQRALAYYFAQVSAARAVLPDPTAVVALRELSLQSERDAMAGNSAGTPRGLEAAIKDTLRLAFPNGLGIPPDVAQGRVPRAEILADRVWLMVDKKIIGFCAAQNLENKTGFQGSGGDWKMARAAGASIYPGGPEHYSLYRYFALGCGGARDFVAARRALEDLSSTFDGRSRNELRGETRHCELVRWARYGIGGSRNAALAKEAEERFRTESWFGGNAHPTEAQLAELRIHFPEQAARNFACPDNGPMDLIDPRDPWKDLR